MRIPIRSMIAFVCLGFWLVPVAICAERRVRPEPCSLVGKGACGTVRVFENPSTHAVSVKKYYDTGFRFTQVEEFLAGNMLAKTLSHPGIVSIEEVCLHDPDNENCPTVRMAYLTGGTLLDSIKNPARGDLETRLIAKNIVEIVAYLEQKRIFHRDLKPANLIFDAPGSLVIKLVDWDFASKWMDPHYAFVGTPNYAAPETILQRNDQVKNSGMVRNLSKVDVWSLGIILYQLVYGELPYPQEIKEKEALFSHIIDPTPIVLPVETKGRYVPDGVLELLSHLIEKDPNHRCRATSALKKSSWLQLPPPRVAMEDDIPVRVDFAEKKSVTHQINPSMTVGEFMDELMIIHQIRRSAFELYVGIRKMNPFNMMSYYINEDTRVVSVKFYAQTQKYQ